MAHDKYANLKLFTCNSHPELAQEIAEHMGIELGKSTVTKFSDGEISVSIWESVRGKDCFIVQSTNDPVNDNLMELLIMTDALTDEATSALDPQTTNAILSLLKRINEEMGITIIIITHQMSVVQEICNKVAIIEKGQLVENGRVSDIFANPQSKAGKMLVIGGKDPDEWDTEAKKSAETDLLHEARKIRIVFETNSSYEPVIANMVLNFGTPVNILRANTRNVEGTARGDMILGLPDDEDLQERMIAWLKEKKLSVSEVTEDV